ncbi:MAG: 5-oxoprolinase subunit PxpB [Phascolarctobacterium sp.]|nr:5-oxoprolinase subunit PxpB [Phascolarctobacterium sp.]
MSEKDYHLMSVGENCIFVQFGQIISPAIHTKVKKLADYLESHPFPRYIEFVATYTGISVNFNPWQVKRSLAKNGQTAHAAISELLEGYIKESVLLPEGEKNIVEVPVCYGGEYGPDLDIVAFHNNMTPEEVIKIHSSGEYLCYMIGFCPGFPYLGGMDERIATPRKETPRLAIPARSIGIAGHQTGGYPISIPGGWQIMGRCALEMFDANAESPTLLKAGDIVHFRSISEKEYLEIRGGVE